MKDLKYFIQKNYVFVSAILSAILLAMQQFMTTGPIDWLALLYAVFIAVAGTTANQWKGKGITLTGIIGTVANVFVTVNDTGQFTCSQFILSVLFALLTAFLSSLKPPTNEN